MPRLSPLAKHAPGLAERGFRVLPLRPAAKQPALRGWQQLATTDADQIEQWAVEFPSANVGIALAGDFVVVDVDDGDRFEEWLGGRDLPPTYTVRTGKGVHKVYRLPADVGPVATTPVAGGDLKASGLVVAAGSVHPTGARYRVTRDVSPVMAPAWLVEQVKRNSPAPSLTAPTRGTKRAKLPPRPAEADRDSSQPRQLRVESFVRMAPEGERNNRSWWGFKKAFMAGGNADFVDRIERTALDIGLPPEEVASVMQSAHDHVRSRYHVPELR